MIKTVKKCHTCHGDFRASELIYYCTLTAKTGYYYCPKCLEEKKAREAFSNAVCMIFGLKAPGPRIWTERKRLQDKYGYTDQIIIDCLEYIYKVEHTKKLAESLCLVGPVTVDKMMQYKKNEQNKANSLVNATTNNKMTEYIVPIAENKTNKRKQILNPEDFLDD